MTILRKSLMVLILGFCLPCNCRFSPMKSSAKIATRRGAQWVGTFQIRHPVSIGTNLDVVSRFPISPVFFPFLQFLRERVRDRELEGYSTNFSRGFLYKKRKKLIKYIKIMVGGKNEKKIQHYWFVQS